MHDHDKIPVLMETGQKLDMDRLDLGHPGEDLWGRLHGHCKVGTLICKVCPEGSTHKYLYLAVSKGGTRFASTYSQERVSAAGLGPSDEHKALQATITRLAEQRGLTAVEESHSETNKRITDVLVTGGVTPVGWEVQLSSIPPRALNDRVDLAVSDGLTPSWLSMTSSDAWSVLINRAPATTTNHLTLADIRSKDDIQLQQGIQCIGVERCRHRRQRWHQGLECTGQHAFPSGWQYDYPTLGQMIERTASGEMVAIRWPRPVGRYKRFWLWVPAEDARRFHEVEHYPTDRYVAPVEESTMVSRHAPPDPVAPEQPVRESITIRSRSILCTCCGMPYSYLPEWEDAGYCVACEHTKHDCLIPLRFRRAG